MKKHLMPRVFILVLVCAVLGCTTTGTGVKKPSPVLPKPDGEWVEPSIVAQWIIDKIREDGRGHVQFTGPGTGASVNQKVRILEKEGRIRDALWMCAKALREDAKDQCDPALVDLLREKSRAYAQKALDAAQQKMQEGAPQQARRSLLEGLYFDPNNERIFDALMQIPSHPNDVYAVANGDTLSEIAKKYYDDTEGYRVIAAANHIMNSDFLHVGDPLLIPVFIPEKAPEPAEESTAEPLPEPGTETPLEPAAETATEPITEAAPEPGAETAAEPAVEPAVVPGTTPVAEPATEPITEAAPEPGAETVTEPVVEPAVVPGTTPMAEPASEPAAEPITEAAPKPGAETVTEPVVEPAVVPVAPPVTEPVSEPVAEPAADTVKSPPDQKPPEPKPAVDPQLLMEARALFSQSQDNEAAAVCEKILDQDPSNTQAIELKNAAYLRLAKRMMDKKEYEMALMALHKTDPERKSVKDLTALAKKKLADKYYREGVTFFTQELLDKAIEAFEKVLFLDPSHPHVQKDLQKVRQLKNKLEKIQ